MDRQAIIRNAFKFPELLDEELIVELVKQMSKDASTRQRNMRRTMNAGALDEKAVETRERYNRKRRSQKKNAAWGAPIPAGIAIWD